MHSIFGGAVLWACIFTNKVHPSQETDNKNQVDIINKQLEKENTIEYLNSGIKKKKKKKNMLTRYIACTSMQNDSSIGLNTIFTRIGCFNLFHQNVQQIMQNMSSFFLSFFYLSFFFY